MRMSERAAIVRQRSIPRNLVRRFPLYGEMGMTYWLEKLDEGHERARMSGG
jgi:hypothetical protein